MLGKDAGRSAAEILPLDAEIGGEVEACDIHESMTTVILDAYLSSVRATIGSGAATDERSHYPALKDLFTELGKMTNPRVRAEADPAGIGGSFPDLAVLETATKVLVLPVEAKPPSWTVQRILDQPKTTTYATSFGGGRVLVTNIHTVALAEVDATGVLKVLSSIELVDPSQIASPSSPATATDDEVAALLDYATEVRATIVRPQQVAHHLAEHAAAMRDQILASGDSKDLLSPIWDLFESGLGAELDEEFFVPTVVQTLVYGLFAGWLSSTDDAVDFDWQSAAYEVDVPLFADVLHASLRPYLIRRCNLFPRLAAVAGVLRRVDKEKFNASLDGGAIEYFYEPFLAEFDSALRDRLGVWYTPREVADFQVAECDHHLRTKLGVAAGLADESVIVLDPAVGTGTYLAAIYRFLYAREVANGEAPSTAAARVKKAALSRIIGFEILPAAFIVCHLSLAQSLRGLGVPIEDHERLRVYLTNSLTGWDPQRNTTTTTLFPELDEELLEARSVKQREPVLVVLGNPPYEGYSSAESDEEQELIRPWIEPLHRNWGLRKHRLNDLYARFWAAAIKRIELTDRGVVSFIANSQWLTGRSYPEMRAHVLDAFDDVLVTDLHGDVHDRSHPGDESVFSTDTAAGIRVGVAICTAVRLDGQRSPAAVTVSDIRGSAKAKRAELLDRMTDPERNSYPVAVSEEGKWRFSSHTGNEFPHLDDYFTVNDRGDSHFSGVQPGRGGVATDHDRPLLEQRVGDYFDHSIGFADLTSRYPDFGKKQARYDPPEVRRKLLGRAGAVTTGDGGFSRQRVKRLLFRPMEPRWFYWEVEHKFLTEPRQQMVPFWAIPGQRALVAPQTPRRSGASRPLVSSQVPCNEAVDPNARVFPLWRPDALGATGVSTGSKLPAIAREWIVAARSNGMTGTDDDVAEGLFYAIAGVGLSAKWLDTQEQNSDDLPAIPVPADPAGLREAARIGRLYSDLVDPDIDVPGVTSGAIAPELQGLGIADSTGGAVVTKGRFGSTGGERRGDDIFWDDTSAWRNVPEAVWRFSLGGFTVLPKWLSYRVDSPLSYEEKESFMHLVRRIQAIILLVPEADSAFAKAGAAPLTA